MGVGIMKLFWVVLGVILSMLCFALLFLTLLVVHGEALFFNVVYYCL